MVKPKQPEFSTPTRLVFARLDRTLPVDEEKLKEMEAKRIILPVARHDFLRRRFEATGYSSKYYKHIYAIPFRKPNYSGIQSLHNRSIHTINAGKNQFVFKGTGLAGSRTSFQLRGDRTVERQFYGGARWQTIAQAASVLGELENAYASAKKRGDPIVQWAVAQGVTELPIIKHAAVFTPLQALEETSTEYAIGTEPKGIQRRRITRKLFKGLGLSKFYDARRVHVYTAKDPTRIAEYKREEDLATAIKKHLPLNAGVRRKALKQFLAREILLLHIAHSKGITLSNEYGSVINPENVGPREFFDFDTAGKYKTKTLRDKHMEKDWDCLKDIYVMAHHAMRYDLGPMAMESSIYANLIKLRGVLRDETLSANKKKAAIDKLVDEVTRIQW